uniref:Uncharacterized protein n=1 Tax=Schistosoma haematobium TaxID=6185 RepID=A0A095AMY6_SCHHA
MLSERLIQSFVGEYKSNTSKKHEEFKTGRKVCKYSIHITNKYKLYYPQVIEKRFSPIVLCLSKEKKWLKKVIYESK